MERERLQVLIVDDEYRIGILIKKLIHWEKLNLECMNVVDNGVTALEQIRQKKPDIIITDIRMPKIDGLELTQLIREIKPEAKVIIVSGYKEFEYAHGAIQLGVAGYLVKPINEGKLNEVLQKASREYSSQKETVQLRETVSKSQQIIRRNLLNNIIEQEELPDDSERILKKGVYCGTDIKLDYINDASIDRIHEKVIVEKLMSIVESILNEEAQSVLICEKEYLHIYCLFSYTEDRRSAIKDCLGKILLEAQKYLMESELFEVTIGVGKEKESIGNIRFSIKEAYRAIGNRIRFGTGRLIFADAVSEERPEEDRSKNFFEEIKNVTESFSVNKLYVLVDAFFSESMQERNMDYSVCYEKADEMVDLFFDQFSTEELMDRKNPIKYRIQNCSTIHGLKKCLKQELGECLKLNKEVLENEFTKPIRQAKQYIEEHFKEKIVLEDIAAIVGLNPVYFSVLFKKETEMNFSAYLLNIRMSKARVMLCNTNETIAAIAEAVGYKDSRYFSQTFEKTVGVKPALYRRLHS